MKTPIKANYAALVAEAEAAVGSVKDPELRRVAFEKILATLLGQDTTNAEPRRAGDKTQRSKTDVGRPTRITPKKGRGGPKAYVEQLIADGFFGTPHTIAEVKAELANRGRHIALTSLSGPLQALTQSRQLRRQKVAANGKGSKATYVYSNW